MALTWADARTKVRGDLWRPGISGVPDDVCDRALHSSILELEQDRRWLWLENIRRTVALTEAAAQFPLPADLRSIASIAQVRADGEMLDAMTPLPVARVRIMASSEPSNSWPSNYALSGGIVYLDGIVPAGTRFELVATAGTNLVLEDAVAGAIAGPVPLALQLHQAAIVARACAEVAATYLKNEAEEARQMRSYERALERIGNKDDEAREDNYGPGIIPDTYYRDISGC